MSSIPQEVIKPIDSILRSFNVFKIGREPDQIEASDIVRFLRKCVKDPIPGALISEADESGMNSDYREQTTTQRVKEELSISVGVKGKYGVYSGSVQVDYSNETSMATTSFYSSYNVLLKFGSIYYNGGPDKITSLLDPEMKRQLNAITTLAQAAAFTREWGTHLVTSVKTGGSLFVGMESFTSTLDEKSKVSAKVNAEYSAITSISLAATAIHNVSRYTEVKSIAQKISAIGGDPVKALAINPANAETMVTWASSCNKNTIYTISDSIEIYTLAENANAKQVLKKYIHLVMLRESLIHPMLYMATRPIKKYNQNQITITPGSNEYKVLGGGASATMYSSSYLGGSYPSVDDEGNVTGWTATSHDIEIEAKEDTDKITAYVLAVHDPENYLETKLVKAKGTHTGIGGDEATATLPDGWQITCGGCRSNNLAGGMKFITASYPADKNNWHARISDYKTPVPGTNVELTSYIIGIKSKAAELVIKSSFVEAETDAPNQHGNVIAKTSSCICGGGVKVLVVSGPGNLVQRSYPTNPKWWEEYNSDLAGLVSPARTSAYAIYLKAEITI